MGYQLSQIEGRILTIHFQPAPLIPKFLEGKLRRNQKKSMVSRQFPVQNPGDSSEAAGSCKSRLRWYREELQWSRGAPFLVLEVGEVVLATLKLILKQLLKPVAGFNMFQPTLTIDEGEDDDDDDDGDDDDDDGDGDGDDDDDDADADADADADC